MDQDQANKLISLGYRIRDVLWWIGICLVALVAVVAFVVYKAANS